MKTRLALIAAAVAFATSATAAERPGFYIGGDVGQSNWNLSEADANDLTDALAGTIGGLANATIVDTSTDFSDTDTTYSLFVGYQILPWLAVEAAWMDLGNMNVESAGTYSFTTINPPPANVATGGSFDSRTEFQSSGPAVSALLMLPFMETWNVYGRLGYYMGDNELIGNYDAQNVRLGTPIGAPYAAGFEQSDDSGVFLWGAGVSYTWNQRVSLRLEYTNITDVVEIDADNASDMERFTLGVAYRFGHVEEPMAPMADGRSGGGRSGCAHQVRGRGQRRRVRYGRQVPEHGSRRTRGPAWLRLRRDDPDAFRVRLGRVDGGGQGRARARCRRDSWNSSSSAGRPPATLTASATRPSTRNSQSVGPRRSWISLPPRA